MNSYVSGGGNDFSSMYPSQQGSEVETKLPKPKKNIIIAIVAAIVLLIIIFLTISSLGNSRQNTKDLVDDFYDEYLYLLSLYDAHIGIVPSERKQEQPADNPMFPIYYGGIQKLKDQRELVADILKELDEITSIRGLSNTENADFVSAKASAGSAIAIMEINVTTAIDFYDAFLKPVAEFTGGGQVSMTCAPNDAARKLLGSNDEKTKATAMAYNDSYCQVVTFLRDGVLPDEESYNAQSTLLRNSFIELLKPINNTGMYELSNIREALSK